MTRGSTWIVGIAVVLWLAFGLAVVAKAVEDRYRERAEQWHVVRVKAP